MCFPGVSARQPALTCSALADGCANRKQPLTDAVLATQADRQQQQLPQVRSIIMLRA